MDVAHISQGLSYKGCSTVSPTFFLFGLFILVLGTTAIIHRRLVAMLREHMRFVYIPHNREENVPYRLIFPLFLPCNSETKGARTPTIQGVYRFIRYGKYKKLLFPTFKVFKVFDLIDMI